MAAPSIDRRSALAERALDAFVGGGAGYARIEPDVLQPAEVLRALYGEAINERAFAVAGEPLRLRSDYTVPVARAHLAANDGAGAARYAYAGPVFRRPDPADPSRPPVETRQAGVEILGEPSDAARDAEPLLACLDTLRALGAGAGAGDGLTVATGDLGVLFALLEAIDMPQRWRARLKRHAWRPARFLALLRKFGGADPGGDRLSFLKAVGALSEAEATAAIREMIRLAEAPQIGRRTLEEAAARLLAEAQDAQRHPLPPEAVRLVEAVLDVRGPSDAALARLRSITAEARHVVDAQRIEARLDRMAARLDTLAAAGTSPNEVVFDAGFGRNLEYYDGFVFEISRMDAQGPLRLGGGGRYDGLLSALGAPAATATGVGAALRLDALAAMDRSA